MYPFRAARGNCKSFYSSRLWAECLRLKIEKVIFNEPATIVLWSDGTKTVVKCDESETFDHEKGLAMAIAKRFLRTNTTGSNYYDEFKKWLPKEETEPVTEEFTLYADGEPILTKVLDGLTNSINYMLREIPEEKMDSVKGKHMKGE